MFANTVVMVRPVDFAFNPETSADNEFQNVPDIAPEQVTQHALTEFAVAVNQLTDAGIKVLVLEDANDGVQRPDAVFPNNWFGTDEFNSLYYFPMKTANRRVEVRPTDVERLLKDNGYGVAQSVYVGGVDCGTQVLEGTGSIIFDHQQRVAYAALSDRCQLELLTSHCQLRGYELVAFDSFSSKGLAVYHTNVVMSVGVNFVVLCTESVPEHQRPALLDAITQSGKTLVEISFAQMEQSFCGNILQLQNHQGDYKVAMSRSAFNGFTDAQKAVLAEQSELVVVDIPTIEQVGGGSCRCMLAEVFNQAH